MSGEGKVGLIGGGQMGEALIRGMLAARVRDTSEIMVLEPETARQEYLKKTYAVTICQSPAELASGCTVIIVAIKPQIIEKVLSGYRGLVTAEHLLISIAAGIPISTLEKILGADIPIIRVMPNTPCLVLEGASALSGNQAADDAALEQAMEIFSAVGTCVHLPESALDAVTGLSGSGPGYVFTFIEAMIDGGVLAGLPRPIAEKLVLQTVYGSAKLALETGEAPAVLKGRVTSPAGTTITGIQVLEEAGMRGTVMAAVAQATERSRELGQ